jgi:hypothetical protein
MTKLDPGRLPNRPAEELAKMLRDKLRRSVNRIACQDLERSSAADKARWL